VAFKWAGRRGAVPQGKVEKIIRGFLLTRASPRVILTRYMLRDKYLTPEEVLP
jgi:hypothetical protein